jgi:hypothetical protein
MKCLALGSSEFFFLMADGLRPNLQSGLQICKLFYDLLPLSIALIPSSSYRNTLLVLALLLGKKAILTPPLTQADGVSRASKPTAHAARTQRAQHIA